MIFAALAYSAEPVCDEWGEATTISSGGPVTEPSGLTIVDGRIYTHSDRSTDAGGGIAKLYWFEEALGGVYEQVVINAENYDWEDLGVGPCAGSPEGSRDCLYIADIGDNAKVRESIAIWRLPVSDQPEVEAEECRLAYPDGRPQDAESLLVFPDGAVEIFTKEGEGDALRFRVPALDCDGEVHLLEELAKIDLGSTLSGGAVNADGTLVTLRTDDRAWIWQGCSPDWTSPDFEIELPDEPNGEAIAFDEKDHIYTAWEGVRPQDGSAPIPVSAEDFEVHVRDCTRTTELSCPDCGCSSTGVPLVGPWGLLLVARARRRG